MKAPCANESILIYVEGSKNCFEYQCQETDIKINLNHSSSIGPIKEEAVQMPVAIVPNFD